MVQSPSMKNYAKMGFGLGLGVVGVHIMFLLIGLVLLVIGNVQLAKAKQNGTSKVVPYTILVLGVALGMGLGASNLLADIDI
jgi:hypothetical protein